MAETNCPKCGAPLEFEVGTLITECSFCDSRVFIDRSGAHFFYILPFFNNAEQAVGIFRRWAAGPKKVKNLDALASVQKLVKQYFPIPNRRAVVQRQCMQATIQVAHIGDAVCHQRLAPNPSSRRRRPELRSRLGIHRMDLLVQAADDHYPLGEGDIARNRPTDVRTPYHRPRLTIQTIDGVIHGAHVDMVVVDGRPPPDAIASLHS